MKKRLQSALQGLLGFRRYLFWFSRFKVATLRWDSKEGDFLHFLKMLPRDANLLDIGANLGIMTVPMARHAKNGEVHAVEPMPDNLDALKRIIRHYRLGNVTLHETALGEEEGKLTMVMPEVQSVKMQGLSHVVHDSIEGYDGGGQTFELPQTRLDQLWPQDKPLHGIKIDVENFEYYVLSGGRELIQREKPLIYAELWDNENRAKCFALLGGMGYRIQVLEKSQLEDFEAGRHRQQNFFFVPPGHPHPSSRADRKVESEGS